MCFAHMQLASKRAGQAPSPTDASESVEATATCAPARRDAMARRIRISLLRDEDGRPIVRVVCRLDHDTRRVWRALTDEDELAVWYPTRVRIDPVAGGTITFAFPGGEPFAGEVLDAQPPELLVFTTRDDVLRWTLRADGDGTELTLDNHVAHPPHAPYTAAGFEISFEQLATLLDAGPDAVSRIEMPPPDAQVDRYAQAFAATAS
jgi:uncharacterized protein YndB with AHSA1/START domain